MTGNRLGKIYRLIVIILGLILSFSLNGCRRTVAPKLKIGCLRETAPTSIQTSGNLPAVEAVSGGSIPDNTICGDGMITISGVDVIDLPYSEEDPEKGFYPVIKQAADDGVGLLISYTAQSELKQAAKTAEFFGIPLLLPVTTADASDRSNSFPVFTLAPSIQDTVNYLFGSILDSGTRQAVNNRIFQDAVVEDYSINVGVWYEDSSFGETAAVETARAAIGNGFTLTLYREIDSRLNSTEVRQIFSGFSEEEVRKIDIFLIISDNPGTGISAASFPASETASENKPLVIYWYEQAGKTDPVQILDDAQSVMIRQAIDRLDCPPEITASVDAENLAGASMVESVFADRFPSFQVRNNFPGLFGNATKKEDIIKKSRGMILEQIRSMDHSAPCLGRIIFDSDGSNSNPRLEMVTGIDGYLRVVTKNQILDALAAKVRADLLSENSYLNP